MELDRISTLYSDPGPFASAYVEVSREQQDGNRLAALQARAARRHQSLQQYLALELRRLAQLRPISEVLDEVDALQGGRVGLDTAVADLDEERSAR